MSVCLSRVAEPGAVVLEPPAEWQGDDGIVLVVSVDAAEQRCLLHRPSLSVLHSRHDKWTPDECSAAWHPLARRES